MKRLIWINIIVGLTFAGCGNVKDKYSYPQNPALSKTDGQPIDSLTFFFPTELKYGDSLIATKLDSFRMKWYSSQLYPANEKILYNYYQGNIYRFIWLRSFDNPVIISISRDGGKVWLTVKKLDRQPSFMTTIYKLRFHFPKTNEKQGPKFNFDEAQSETRDSIVLPNRHANLLVNETKELQTADWEKFEQLLTACSYWTMPPCDTDLTGFDGSQWIIEASSQSQYWFVDRWSPKNCFKECGQYLIKLSGLKDEVY